MRIDFKRGTINAANTIIKDGLEFYFINGVRFGFFDQTENPKDLAMHIHRALVEDYKEVDLAKRLLEALK